MDPRILDAGLGIVSLGAWSGLYGLLLLTTRPRSIRPEPATQDLGGEPPAVVSLLTNGWEVTDDAAESTLIDLAARRVLEFRQPANDPRQTTVHIVANSPTGLTPYERRVFERVAGLAVGRVVPLTALTFRDERKAQLWWKHLRAEVITDARARGLSQRRFSPAVVATLSGAAALAALGIAIGILHWLNRTNDKDAVSTAFYSGVFVFLVLSAWGAHPVGERDTPAGREVAAHWHGVRAWLRAHDAFADLPPASVAVWDRYLGYGAAVGATRVASAVIDMGMGNRRRVWSSFGGTWHRVRVRYPHFGVRHGKTLPRLLARAVIAGGIGYLLVKYWTTGIDKASSADLVRGNPLLNFANLIQLAGLATGVVLLAHAAYQLARILIDAVAPITLTGQVLWLQLWKQTSSNNSSTPMTYYLALDAGTADRTTAWALPATLYHQCDVGDTVKISARRWSRRVYSVTMLERGGDALATRADAGPGVPDLDATGLGAAGLGTAGLGSAGLGSAGLGAAGLGAAGLGAVGAQQLAMGNLVTQMLGSGAADVAQSLQRSTVLASSLLTAEEASQALGMPVTRLDTALPGMMGMVQFSSTDRNRVVLMLQVAEGAIGRLAWRAGSRGDPLPGIGDGAFTKADRAAAHVGDTTVILTLLGVGRGSRRALPKLLAQAVARVTP